MWGMGNRNRAKGPDETSERALFSVLEAKDSKELERKAGRRISGRACSDARHRGGSRERIRCRPARSRARTRTSTTSSSTATSADGRFRVTTGTRCSPRRGASPVARRFRRSGSTTALDRPTPVRIGTNEGHCRREPMDVGDGNRYAGEGQHQLRVCRQLHRATNHQILYFGQQRASRQGGEPIRRLRFLQDPSVSLGANGEFTGQPRRRQTSSCRASFTNGGGSRGIRVNRWTGGSGGSTGQVGDLNEARASTAPSSGPWTRARS